jgi:phosphohistidine swiveling domain-containing protein
MQTSTEHRLIVSLGEGEATLAEVGGKGASLASMAAAGLPVPRGFLLTTDAYRQFLDENGLEPTIQEAVAGLSEADPASWERASSAIEAAFLEAGLSGEVAEEARAAYAALAGDRPERAGGDAGLAVAVRSSATAEDLPGASFAGQQETFLNVRGVPALLDAIRRCWASLWAARALAYRHRLRIDHRTVAMAVVVQELVPAEVAGVLFTANPTTGERGELLINASYGLGEAVVSGQVTPDTYLLDKATLAVKTMTLGAKELMVVPSAGLEAGGTDGAAPDAGQGTLHQPVPEGRRGEPALPEPLLRELAALGVEAELNFGGVPQDIEWAVADRQVWLLQSRPITGLPPAPLRDVLWDPPVPGSKWIRRQVVEHMPEPLSPLFEDLYLRDGLERSIDVVMVALRMPDALDDMIDRPLFATVNGFAYQRADVKLRSGTAPALIGYMARGIPTLFREGVQNWRDKELPAYQETIARWKALDPAGLSDARLLDGVRELARADARYWFATALVIGTAKVTDSLLDTFLSKAAPGRKLSSGRFLRALSNRGMASEAALEEVADLVRGSAELRALVAATPPERLREALAESPAGGPVLEALDAYFEQFGHLIYSLDFAVPTQADNPLPVLLSLRALAARPHRDAEAMLTAMAREREALTRETARSFDPIRRRLFRLLLGWARRYAPYREEALFYVGAAWPTLRRLALELGRRLAETGLLERSDDVFYLTSAELSAVGPASAGDAGPSDPATLARERRALREARKRLQPPAAVPPAYQFKLGPLDLSGRESQKRNTVNGTTLRGFAVSPGRVTALASVIRGPADFGAMQPGMILVCPTTTPAWTPLFSQARALVTDIGGILAHGSIVAREYGIPAVMGTGTATQRIASGQQITVDGDAGTVTLGS